MRLIVILLGTEFDEFVEQFRDHLVHLTNANIDTESKYIWNQLATLPAHRIDTIIDIILQLVCQPMPINSIACVISLMKNVCIGDGSHIIRDATEYFRTQMRKRSLQLLGNILNRLGKQPFTLDCKQSISSLDRQVNRIDIVRFHCVNIRKQRLAHFIGHLFKFGLIGLTEVFDMSNKDPSLNPEFLGNRHDLDQCCCDFELPSNVHDILQSTKYQQVQLIEDHLFWVQIKVSNICGCSCSESPFLGSNARRLMFLENELIFFILVRQ